jgi:NAD(P)-dependent dehydrogenase (short-subunit alcohol dehydrogenase family)/ribulose-5-phosphate 4-epimerase/fuculose-1-phosphate aldolase
MVSPFGIISVRTVERDALGREHERLILNGVGLLPRREPVGYELADLQQVIESGRDVIPADALAWWSDGLARALAPLAVVHAAAPGAVAASMHGDALCVLANLADGRAACEAAFGGEVAWLDGGVPGPALARALGSVQGSAALVPGIGLVAWGASAEDVVARATHSEDRARDWLAVQGLALQASTQGAATPTVASAELPGTSPIDADREPELLKLRHELSHDHRRVLHVDPSLDGLARRDDAARVSELAGALEPFSTWATGSRLVPGLGLVCAGADEPDARDRALVAAHAVRVAAALIDGAVAPVANPAAHAEPPGQPAAPSSPELAPEFGPAAVLDGRIVIVTGAASGIGRDIARHLASIGAQLALADVSMEGLEAVADELDGAHGRPLTMAGDLTDENVIDGLVAATVARFGGIDGAVLNVGVALPGELKALTTADWRRSLDVNTTSHFLLIRRLLPVLEAQGLGGSLVFIGSKNMFSPGAGFGAYSASKAALAQLARLVAIEAGPYGVRSNIVNPDNVFGGSALWSPELRAQRAAVYKIRPEDLEAFYTQRNLMKVPISGMDVARAVAFLLSDEASKTTACILTVDGGVPGVFPR